MLPTKVTKGTKFGTKNLFVFFASFVVQNTSVAQAIALFDDSPCM